MKNILFLSAFFVLSFGAKAQPLEYSQVFHVDSTLTNDELFSRARAWFVEYYKDANTVLQVSDREEGELIGAPMFNFDYNVFLSAFVAHITYRVSVHVRDGRYKVKIYQINNAETTQVAGSHRLTGYGELTTKFVDGKSGVGTYMNEKKYGELLVQTNQMAKDIFISLFTKMKEPISADEDW